MYSEEMELDPAADRDPISDPGPREHFVKCRITRNRKGVRGQSSSDYHCTVDIGLGDTKKWIFLCIYFVDSDKVPKHSALCGRRDEQKL